MTSIKDKNLDYPYPSIIISDNKNMCQTWEAALQDSEFKSMYDEFTEEAQETINNNMSSRICLKIDSEDVSKCYTTNNKLETCGSLAKELPNSLKAEMATLNNQIIKVKKEMMDEMLAFVNEKRDKLTTLIDINSAKQEMVNMNQGYHDLADTAIEDKKEKQSQLADSIEEVDNLKNNSSQTMTNKRKQMTSYQSNNSRIDKFMWWFLLVLLLIITLYFLSLPLTKVA